MPDNEGGANIRAALRRSSVWGEAVQCGPGHGLPLTGSTIMGRRQHIALDEVSGEFVRFADYMGTGVSGEIASYLRYGGIELPLALAMGRTGGVPLAQGSSGAYAHTLTPTPDTAGLMGTLALFDGIGVAEFPSVKFASLEIAGRAGMAGGAVEARFGCICDRMLVDGGLNSRASVMAARSPFASERVMMHHAAFLANGFSGPALGQGDVIYPSGFSLALKRPMAGAHTVSSAGAIDEPSLDGPAEASLVLSFARPDGRFAAWQDGEPSKMTITFTGSRIGGPFQRTLRITIPSLAPVHVGASERGGRPEHEVRFVCLGTASAGAGMEGVTSPFEISLVNTSPSDPLI